MRVGSQAILRRGLLVFAAFFLTLPLARGVFAAQVEKAPAEIQVTAESMGVAERGQVVEAKGDVRVLRGETLLKADAVKVNRTTQEVEAKGAVTFEDPHGRLKADAVQFNLEKETGIIENGDIFFEANHLSVSGKRFEKRTGQAYHVDEAFFTTCLCESGPPTWKMGAEQVDLQPEGKAVLSGATLYWLDIPVFYFPYAYFPIRTERQTGFLFPRIGSSTKDGFRYQQPFFWAISKSSDATIVADVETRTRIGALGEYRTIFSRQAEGQFSASFFDEGLRKSDPSGVDPNVADRSIPQDRWSVAATHRHRASSGWITYSDIAAFSDDLFTRELVYKFNLDLGPERNLRSSRYGRSQFGFLRWWGDSYLETDWGLYQDFIQQDDRTLQKTPQIVWGGLRPVHSGELRWRAEGVQYIRKESADGLRLDLRPELVWPFQVASFAGGALSVAPRETLYHLYRRAGFSGNSSRELVELRGSLGTAFGRTFFWGGSSVEKLRHVVEPEIKYLFIPATHQRDIPIMDTTDRIDRRNVFTLALTNRLWAKGRAVAPSEPADKDVELLTTAPGGEIRELVRLGLALSYDVDKERKGGDTLSDLDFMMRVSPLDFFSLGAEAGVNPGPWQFTRAALLFSLSDPRPVDRRVLDRDFRQPNSLSLSYQFIRKSFLAPLAENANLTPTELSSQTSQKNLLEELDLRAVYHLMRQLLLTYDAVYNARDHRFTNNRGGAKWLSSCECWSFGVTVQRKTNPTKTEVKFEFNLVGLSSPNINPRE